MKITRKVTKIDEATLTDMYAETLLQKYYEEKWVGSDTEEFLSLCVTVDKSTGVDRIFDLSRFDNYEECKEDDKLNRTLLGVRFNCYALFITGKRIEFLKDKPLYVVIEAEAIEF